MKRVYAQLAETINKRPFLIAGIVIAVLIVCIFGATQVTMKTGSDTYLDKTEHFGSLEDHYENEFGSDSVILIIEGDDVKDPEVIRYIDSIEEDMLNERYVTSVMGLPDIIKQLNNGVLPSSKAEIDQIADQIPEEYKNMLLPSPMMTLALVSLEPSTPEDANEAILDNFKSIVKFANPPPGVSVIVSGNPAFQTEMKNSIGESTGTLILLAMLLMVLAMAFLFGHVRYRFLPVFVVFCGIIMTFGVMGIAGIPLSMIVVAAFPVLIGIGIDYAIQIQSRIDEDVREMPLLDAIKETVKNTGPAVLLAMIATALGFFALMVLASSPMVADFGKICIIGIICCYISALIIIPTFARIIDYKPKDHPTNLIDDAESCQLDWQGCDHTPHAEKEHGKGNYMARYDRALGKTAGVIAKNPVVVLLICFALAVTGFQLDSQIIINTDEDAMVPQDMPAKVDMDKITRVMGSTNTITLFIYADDVLDLSTLEWMDGFSDYVIDRQDDITGATSIVTYLKLYNNGALPKDKNTINEVLEKIPSSTKESYLSGNTQAVIQFSMEDISIPATEELIGEMERDLEWYTPHPGISASYTGTMAMFTHLIDGIRETKNPMTYLGFALILGFLVLVYRKFTAISPIIPIIMIVGWNSLIMYLLGLDYSLLTATLGAMSIGVASEYTILIMERYQEERSKGVDMLSAVQKSIQKIGTAVTVSGLTTVFGFSALMISDSPIISNFGTVTVVTVAFSVIGAILVMPAVIAVMDRFEKAPKNKSA